MYDSVGLRLDQETVPNTSLIEEIPNHLSKVICTQFENGGISISGYLDKKLRVRVNPNNIKIEGSLCKYYYGNNIETIGRRETQKAIEMISDSIHLPIEKANCTRIDIAQNIIVNHDCSLYYPYLGQLQYYNRLEQDNGLYYNNYQKQLVFYGKIQEQKKKGNEIPSYFKDKNILRYEIRYKRRLPKLFNCASLTAKKLYDENFYKSAIDLWIGEYKRIQKQKNLLNNMTPTGSTKKFVDNLALIGLSTVDPTNAFKAIKEWQTQGEITKKQALDLREKIKRLSNMAGLTRTSELTAELDQKIIESVRYYR